MTPILYRWWDADGRLLYVGKSVSVFARIAAHRSRSAFFEDAATMTMQRFETPLELGRAEVAAIQSERPLHNIMHSYGGAKDAGRKITVIDGPLPALDTNVGHWEPVEPSEVRFSDIIRCVAPDGELLVQGLIDDDFYGEEFGDPDDDGWYVLTDMGTEALLWRSTANLSELDRWVSVAGEDPFRMNIMSTYIDAVVSRTLTMDGAS